MKCGGYVGQLLSFGVFDLKLPYQSSFPGAVCDLLTPKNIKQIETTVSTHKLLVPYCLGRAISPN